MVSREATGTRVEYAGEKEVCVKLEDIRPGYYTITKPLRNGVEGGDFGRVREFGNGVPFFDTNDNDGLVAVSELIEDGWTFNRLVTAKEVENAYREGCIDGHNANPDGLSVDPDWERSRSKRVMEGLE